MFGNSKYADTLKGKVIMVGNASIYVFYIAISGFPN